MYKHTNLLGYFYWIAGILFLAQAVKIWHEYDYHNGYKTAVEDLDTWNTKAVFDRLNKEPVDVALAESKSAE